MCPRARTTNGGSLMTGPKGKCPLPPPPPSPRTTALWQGLGFRAPPTTAPQHTHQHRTGPPHSQANTGSGPPPPPPSTSRHCGRGWGHSHLRGREVRWGGRGAQLCSQPSSPDSLVLGAVTASSVFSLKPEFWVSPLLTVSALAQSYAGHRHACQCGF